MCMMYEGFSANLSFTGLIGKFVQKKEHGPKLAGPTEGKDWGCSHWALGRRAGPGVLKRRDEQAAARF